MTGIFIIARLGSTRLPQKHLIKASGKTFIEWLVERFIHSFQNEIVAGVVRIFIVTSEHWQNKAFETLFANNKDVHVFYGADANIPLRQLQCAAENEIGHIISIDGDDILCSTHASQLIYTALLNNSQYCKTSGLPLGMNVMGYQSSFLKEAVEKSDTVTLETGWGRIFNNEALEEIRLENYDKDNLLRLTLDYEEDALFFKTVINTFGTQIFDLKDRDLIQFILTNAIYEINQNVSGKYWENFDLQKRTEI